MTFQKIILPDFAVASNAEVVDSIADILGFGLLVEKQLGDGFQLTDLLALLQGEQVVREIVRDLPVFLDEFGKLPAATVVDSLESAIARATNAEGQPGKVMTFVIDFLRQSAVTYQFADTTYRDARTIVEAYKNMFRKREE